MEEILVLMIPAFLAVLLVRTLLLPLQLGMKVALHGLGGFVCLWLLNTVSGFTGILFPMNAVTVLLSGFFGLPGMAVMVFLALV